MKPQKDQQEKNKKEKKEKKEGKERTKHYKKDPKETKILTECFENWLKEPLNSPNKDKICAKYHKILLEEEYDYKLEDVKHYCGNHFQALKKRQKLAQQNLQASSFPPNNNQSPVIQSPNNQFPLQQPQPFNPPFTNQNSPTSLNQTYIQQQSPLNSNNNNNNFLPQQQQQSYIQAPPTNQDQLPMQVPSNQSNNQQQSSNGQIPSEISYSLTSPTPSGTIEYASSDKYFLNSQPGSSIEIFFNENPLNSKKDDDETAETVKTSSKDDQIQNQNQNEEDKAKAKEDKDKEDIQNQEIEGKNDQEKLVGKTVGKEHYFPQNTVFSSSSSSDSSGVLPLNLRSSSDRSSVFDMMIASLPEIPTVSGEIDTNEKEQLKQSIYMSIQSFYDKIHKAADFYCQRKNTDGHVVFNENFIKFQIEVEKRFVSLLGILKDVCGVEQIYSSDKQCDVATMANKGRTVSGTTRLYNRETPSPMNSMDIPFASSASIKRDNEVKGSNSNDDSHSDVNCSVEILTRNLRTSELSEKLTSFFRCDFVKESQRCFDVADVEAATVVSNDFLVSELAYVSFDFNSHVLNLKGAKVETGFYFPATSIYFHRESSKLYVCGDVRVKEFTIESDDDKKTIRIENTNTFFFGKENFYSSAIAVWGDRLALGFGLSVYVWSLSGADSTASRKPPRSLSTRANKKLVSSSGVDVNKVDWSAGVSYDPFSTIEIVNESFEQITSLAVLGQGEYLAIASSQYPVVYVYNADGQCLSRLVSHTMGVTSLRSFNYKLFTGSLDLTARLWDVNVAAPEMLINTMCEKVTAIEVANYDGQLLVFTGTDKNNVQCTSVNMKKPLFEIKLNRDVAPRCISFVEDVDKCGKLMIVSDYVSGDGISNLKKCQVQFFEFK